ncbi:putative outer membrane protein [Pedobacter sp. BAL39]|uniref:TonB-dependent receptor n=1 Tax=Pedobacter sp. BAL39 TaxID=391596 RepID=UPI000155A39E|nr:TonB-dependent receptor [Pedobacter sp. BAL39]EDM34488.1 putative outer membrane protein [Pedobacter sp. BAL39]
MKRGLFLMALVCLMYVGARAQRPFVTKAALDGLYTMSMSRMLDTIAVRSNFRIVYEQEMVEGFSISDHFNQENVKEVLARMCKEHNLHYWVASDQVIYIIRKPEDVHRLMKLNRSVSPETQSTVPAAGIPASIGVSTPLKPEVLEAVEQETAVVGSRKPIRLTGRIVDRKTGESLPSAIIRVSNTTISTTANLDGYFTLLRVPSDTCRLEVNYIGYQPEMLQLNKDNVQQELIIGLFPSIRMLTEVVITDKKGEGVMSVDKRRVSVLQISPARLEELPNIGEKDILRSFQLMPGVSGSNESSSGAYVRGGTPDQNLVLFDGFTVYQVDHLYGFFSAFNSNAVKDVTLYKGGFSAKYGGRLSSVTDITGKEGNSKESNIAGDLSLLSANIFLEKPVNEKSTLLLAYRRSYQGPLYDKIFNKFNSTTATTTRTGGGNTGAPGGPPGGGFGGSGGPTVTVPSSYFYDLNAKYTYAPDQRNRFSWSIYQGNDNLDNSRDMNLPSFIGGGGGLSTTDKTTYGNLGSSFKWSSKWSSKLYSNTLISYSTYHSDRDNSVTATIQDEEGNEQEINNGTFEKNRLRDFSLKSDWELQANEKYKILFGAFASRQNVSYENGQNDTSKLIDQHTKALTTGMYAELELNPTVDFQLKPGIRNTYYDQTGKLYLEPRLSATYTLTDKFTLKASGGRFYQFANRVIREDILSGSRDFWVLANGDAIPVSSANHYIAGFSYETGKFLLDVEAYYKELDNLSEYSQRTTGNPRQRTLGLEEHFYSGSGYSKGLEVMLQKTRGKYTGWISYTLADATNHFDAYGGDFFASQDTRHELKLVNMYRLGKWNFSATWIFATGKPYTAPLTSYTIDDLSGNSHTYLSISDKNALRMPAYHRLDAAVTYDFIKVDSRKTGSIGFSLFNIYNRSNVWYKQYSIINNQVVTSNVNYLSFTPNLTLSLKWK